MIPALAFNDATATVISNAHLLGEHLAQTLPRVLEFINSRKGEQFTSKSSTVIVNGVIVNAASHNGIYIDKTSDFNFDLVFPFSGSIKANIEGSDYVAVGGTSALLFNSERIKIDSIGSNVIIRLNPDRLDETVASMGARNPLSSSLGVSRLLQLDVANFSFHTLFSGLLSQIDAASENRKLLELLAFDDRIYRLSAGLIYPDLLLSNEAISGKRPQVTSEIETLCEYLRANLKQPISLTHMEQFSGLSAHALKIAFNQKLGMGARQWVRKQRLHAARKALLDTHENTSVAFVAYDFCFLSASEFSRHYQQEFGEPPEQTIERRS